METVVGSYCVVVGLMMMAWWAIDLGGGALRRSDRSPAEMRLHLLVEFLTAGGLVVGGALVLADQGSGLALVHSEGCCTP